MKRLACFTMLPFCLLLLSGCGDDNEGLPLPESAKTVSSGTIDIPFPYETQGGERWLLKRIGSDQFEVQVIYRGKVMATFPVSGMHWQSTIILAGQQYVVQHITVNSDNQIRFCNA
jgi:hypothetical protein